MNITSQCSYQQLSLMEAWVQDRIGVTVDAGSLWIGWKNYTCLAWLHFTLLAKCIPTVKDLDEKNLPCSIPHQGLSIPLLIIGKKQTHLKCFKVHRETSWLLHFNSIYQLKKINMPQGIPNLLLNPSGPKRDCSSTPLQHSLWPGLLLLWGSLPVPRAVARAGQSELGNHRPALILRSWKASVGPVLPRGKHAHNWTWSWFVYRSGVEGVNGGNGRCSW